MNKLDAVVIGPEKPKASIIWLHGLGADGHDFVPALPMLHLPKGPFRFVLPHAPVMPVTLNAGMEMPAWFDIENLDFESFEDETGIKKATFWIKDLIDEEIKQGVPSDKIILVGFSQGGTLALYTALHYPKRLGGCAGLSTFMPKMAEKLGDDSLKANRHLDIFLAHGEQDDLVPHRLGQACYDVLATHEWPVEFHSYPMAHQVCMEEMQALGQWIMRCTKVGA